MENNIHKMKLLPEYFEKIQQGSKTVEMRLFDEKRRLIRVGDMIEFSSTEAPSNRVLCRVVDLKLFDSFLALAEYYSPAALGFDSSLTPGDIADFMSKIYCECCVLRVSALAIEIELAEN